MTSNEFSEVLAYLVAALQKPISRETAEVYFDLLGDLPIEALRIAAKRVALEHPWATFPSVAELRQAASETMRGRVCEVSPAEAWDLASRVARQHDPEQSGPYWSRGRIWESQWAAITEGVSPLVLRALRTFGVRAICYGTEPTGVIRGQFMKLFEQLAARDRREALLPGSVKSAIASVGVKYAALGAALAQIGVEHGSSDQ